MQRLLNMWLSFPPSLQARPLGHPSMAYKSLPHAGCHAKLPDAQLTYTPSEHALTMSMVTVTVMLGS